MLAERFWLKVDKSGECWNWTACTTNGGYGRIMVSRSVKMAHRVAYELQVGPIPIGLTIDHLCRNKLCPRATHMEPVTLLENLRRKGRTGFAATNSAKTHCPKGHPLSGENLRGGQRPDNRACKRCCTLNAAKRKARLNCA